MRRERVTHKVHCQVKVTGQANPFITWVSVENVSRDYQLLTKADFRCVLAVVRRELRKRGFTVQR